MSSGIWRNLAISISATRHRSECIAVWKFITTDTPVKKFCLKQLDLRIGAAYSQFGHLGANCPSLDAKIVNKVQNYIDLTFGLFDFEMVGRHSEFFGF